jgi:hypothetical protein
MHESAFIQEFVQEGEQIRARKDVLKLLKARFGEEEADKFKEALDRITDLDRLEELFNLAIRTRRLSQFRKAIGPA